MKKFIFILIGLFLVAGVALNAEARYDREEADEAGYVKALGYSYDKAVVARPTHVHAATILASTTTAYLIAYDNASAASGDVKVEVAEATQWDSTRYVFDPPIQFDNGVYIDVTDGSYIIEYR